MTILANEAANESRHILKKYNKPNAANHADLEVKLAELYFEQPDKIQIEKDLAEIHPHKKWLIKSLNLVPKDSICCKKCDWSWEKSKGGEDPYKCHKCGTDNAEKEEKTDDKQIEAIKNAVSDSVTKFSDFNGSKEVPQQPIIAESKNNYSSTEIIGMVGALGIIGLTFIIVSKNLTK
jgi:hypothetical protein